MSNVKDPPGGYKIEVPQGVLDEAAASVERIRKARKEAEASETDAPTVQDMGTDEATVPLEVESTPAPSVDDDTRTDPQPAAPPEPTKKGPQDAIIEALIKGKQELQEVLNQTQKEAKDLLEARARIQAEFENYKKRVNKDKQEAANAAVTRMARELLPVLDNFERALIHLDQGQLPAELKNLVQGVTLVSKQMAEAFKKVGIIGFSSKGEPFDPAKHEAVSQVPATGDMVPGTVVEEHQKGYLLGEQLLRPAMVVVAGPKE